MRQPCQTCALNAVRTTNGLVGESCLLVVLLSYDRVPADPRSEREGTGPSERIQVMAESMLWRGSPRVRQPCTSSAVTPSDGLVGPLLNHRALALSVTRDELQSILDR